MGGLFGSLSGTLDALRAFQTALAVSQNNVSNVNTPGYARQIATLQSENFDVRQGLPGGVQAGPTQSTQNEYANQTVRTQLEFQGNFGAQTTPLSTIQTLFDVSGQSGVIGALNQLFQSFSAWSTTPTSTAAQQDVLSKAQQVGDAFQSTANSLAKITTDLNQQITSTVRQINSVAADIQTYNTAILNNHTPDAGLDARLHASLESLSQLTNTTVRFEDDGTATVLIGGQTPLVIGKQLYTVQASFVDPNPGPNANAIPDAHILGADGQEITSQVTQGSLGGLLTVRNTVLPSLQGDSNQVGSINQIAKQVADRVNQVLTAGQTPGGASGSPLFAYDTSSPIAVARSLKLDPNITISALAPVQPGTPPVGNGTALALANLGASNAVADQINGQSILQFLSTVASQVGQQTAQAQTGQDLHTQLLTQAHTLRDQLSGVSLDAEALQVLQLQKGYQAIGKMVSVIDGLASTLINMIP